MTPIDTIIDQDPTMGILGKYRFVEDDICLGVLGKHAKLLDFYIQAHMEDVKDHSTHDRYYAIVDIRNMMWANKDMVTFIQNGLFQQHIKAAAILAETDFSQMLGKQWLKGIGENVPLSIHNSLEESMAWIKSIRHNHRKGEFMSMVI